MILKICLCIPCYDNPGTITQVVTDALQLTRFSVLVVDDGSQQPVLELLQGNATAAAALADGRLRVLRQTSNQGKGVAIRAAIADCTAHGFTHLLTVDGDGQHVVSEAPKLVELALQHPWDLIIGQRRMEGETVPGSSRFGRAFSNFWVKYQTGSHVLDSQSGFRLYPLFHLQRMNFVTRRYEFEIEVLIRLLWRGAQVREVEVDVIYPPGSERVSHFRKFTDNVRISLLNTVLVGLSLFRSHRAPRDVGLALGLGIFIGCTPLYGLHTVLAATLAVALRLNAGYLVLGSNISIPPLAPFLIGGSLMIGSWLLTGDSHAGFQLARELHSGSASVGQMVSAAAHSLEAWAVGSLALGLVLGVLFGALGYAIAWGLQRRHVNSVNWTGRTRGGVWGNAILAWVLRTFGLRAGYLCLYFLIPYFYLFAPKARRALHEYWTVVRPKSTPPQRVGLTLRHLYRFGQVLMDRAYASSRGASAFHTRPHGMQQIIDAAAAPHGLIVLGAHTGGWDLAIAALPSDGFKERFHVLRFDAEGLTLDRAVSTKAPEHVASLDSNRAELPVFELHSLLARGQTLGLMGDRPLSSRYELVQFFDQLAVFDVTPFRVAAATGASLIASFGFKAEGMNYDFFAEPPARYRYAPGQDRAVQCRQWAQEFASTLQGYLQRYPEQWFNFFNFWSALPTGPQGALHAASNQLAEPSPPAVDSAAAAGTPPSPEPDWAPAAR